MGCRRKCEFLVALCLLLSGALMGAEWPRFRGPDGAGQSNATTIPVAWTSNDYKWRVELPGVGHSSPVVWGERLFVTSALQEDATHIVRCLETEDGSLVWESRFPSTTFDLGRSTSFDTSSPVVDRDRVYATWGTPKGYVVLALDRHTGKESWRRDLGTFRAQHGFGASPIRFADLLILANDQGGTSSILALDSRTGETKWKVNRRALRTAYATPMIHRTESGEAQLILASSAHGVSSLDPHSGKLHWELEDLFLDNRVVGSPVVAGGLIFAQCGVGGGGRRMVAIRPPDPAAGTEAQVAYEVEGSLPYVPTPVAHGKWLFFISDGGVASYLDTGTGERLWRERIGGNYFSSPVRVGNRIYCISREGELVVLAAAPEFQILGRMDLQEPSHSTPAVAGDVMYIRTLSHLMAIGGR